MYCIFYCNVKSSLSFVHVHSSSEWPWSIVRNTPPASVCFSWEILFSFPRRCCFAAHEVILESVTHWRLWPLGCSQNLGHNSYLEAARLPLFLWVPPHEVLGWLGNPMVIEPASFLLVELLTIWSRALNFPQMFIHSFELSHKELRKGCWQPHLALGLWSKWTAVLQDQLD